MKSPCIKWSQKEITFLRTNLRGMRRREIARQLGRSYSSVCCKAQVLSLAGDRTWTGQEKLILRNRVCSGDTTPQIMQALRRTDQPEQMVRHLPAEAHRSVPDLSRGSGARADQESELRDLWRECQARQRREAES